MRGHGTRPGRGRSPSATSLSIAALAWRCQPRRTRCASVARQVHGPGSVTCGPCVRHARRRWRWWSLVRWHGDGVRTRTNDCEGGRRGQRIFAIGGWTVPVDVMSASRPTHDLEEYSSCTTAPSMRPSAPPPRPAATTAAAAKDQAKLGSVGVEPAHAPQLQNHISSEPQTRGKVGRHDENRQTEVSRFLFFSRIARYIGGTHNARTLIPINTHAHSYPYEHLSE